MSPYPSESSLAVAVVSEMVRRADADSVVAVDPTRAEPAEAPAGYPVRRSSAARLAVRVRAPKYEHRERGLCFEVAGDGVATLSMRDARGAAYVACPRVHGRGDLPDALDACRFVAVHALRADTSRLFVPSADDSRDVTAKVRDADDARGFDRDPANYYRVPDSAVRTWPELAAEIDAGEAGLRIRDGGEPTEEYRAFLDRLADLAGLYPRPDRRDAAAAPRDALDEGAADRLVEHAVAAWEATHADAADADDVADTPDADAADAPGAAGAPDSAAQTAALRAVIDRMRTTRDPTLYRVRRSCELVVEGGSTADDLVLGAPLGDAGRPRDDRTTTPAATADSTADDTDDAAQETTLSEFL